MPRRCFQTDSLLVTHVKNVRYLTGFTGSSGCVLITPRQKIFFTDFRYQIQASREVKGYRTVITGGPALAGACRHIIDRRLKIGVLGFEAPHLSYTAYLSLRKLLKGVKLRDQGGAIEKMRAVKRRDEIRHIRRACALADDAYRRLTRMKVTGRSEREVALKLEFWMREAGSGPMPFGIIVASGPRSAMPHGAATGRIIRRNELVVIDMGATWQGYASDATRTFTTGRLKQAQRHIYDVVAEAQQRAFEGVQAGARASDVDALARGLITRAGYGKEFGHSLGHGVGLEAHEAPTLSTRSRDTLEPGMVVTVEPGIYLEQLGGVRIEDTVLVTRGKPERLTKYPRAIQLLR